MMMIMMMMTADGNDMSNWDFDCHLLPTKVKTSLIPPELPLFAEKPVLVASLAMAGPQTNLMVVFMFSTSEMSEKCKNVFSQACACRLVGLQSQDTYSLLSSSAHPVNTTTIMKQFSRLNFNNNCDCDNHDIDDGEGGSVGNNGLRIV